MQCFSAQQLVFSIILESKRSNTWSIQTLEAVETLNMDGIRLWIFKVDGVPGLCRRKLLQNDLSPCPFNLNDAHLNGTKILSQITSRATTTHKMQD
jgi:hypothetical protein